jgi:predicted SAM-dependent methyltransferase
VPDEPKVKRTAQFRSKALPRINFYARVGVSEIVRNREFLIRRESLRARRYLDIGPGPNLRPGFINLDFQWRRGIDLVWDVGQGIPLESNSLKGIFSEHCIEHISLDAGNTMMGECVRILEPGGTLRLITPDGEEYLSGYHEIMAGSDRQLPRAPRDRYQDLYTPIMTVNRVFCQFGHRFIYDLTTMSQLLERNGFVDIRRSSFGEGADPALVIDTEWRKQGSLYVEATKPLTAHS